MEVKWAVDKAKLMQEFPTILNLDMHIVNCN